MAQRWLVRFMPTPEQSIAVADAPRASVCTSAFWQLSASCATGVVAQWVSRVHTKSSPAIVPRSSKISCGHVGWSLIRRRVHEVHALLREVLDRLAVTGDRRPATGVRGAVLAAFAGQAADVALADPLLLRMQEERFIAGSRALSVGLRSPSPPGGPRPRRPPAQPLN
jgi:hypothetical protein